MAASRQPLSQAGEERGQAAAPEGQELLVFSAPVPLGQGYETRIIHSVQLTPVLDVYRVQEGRIWGWQEHIMSHNAGLPSLAPERGRFRHEPPWMILEGEGHSWETIRYRVGTQNLGANEFSFPGLGRSELWRLYPGQVLLFRARGVPLASLYGRGTVSALFPAAR